MKGTPMLQFAESSDNWKKANSPSKMAEAGKKIIVTVRQILHKELIVENKVNQLFSWISHLDIKGKGLKKYLEEYRLHSRSPYYIVDFNNTEKVWEMILNSNVELLDGMQKNYSFGCKKLALLQKCVNEIIQRKDHCGETKGESNEIELNQLIKCKQDMKSSFFESKKTDKIKYYRKKEGIDFMMKYSKSPYGAKMSRKKI